jgi:excisionase family DNA binding protein
MSQTTHDDELLTVEEAADLVKVHPNAIRNAIRDGRLQAIRLGARIVRIRKRDLLAAFAPYAGGEFGVWR